MRPVDIVYGNDRIYALSQLQNFRSYILIIPYLDVRNTEIRASWLFP